MDAKFNIPQEYKKPVAIGLSVLVVILILYFFGGKIWDSIKGMFSSALGPGGLGLGTTLTQDNVDDANYIGDYVANRNSSSPFAPNLYNNNPDASTMTLSQLQDICGKITKASDTIIFGIVISTSTDEAGMVNAFKNNCQNQIDVSNLSIVFQKQTGRDLLNYVFKDLTGFLKPENIHETAGLLKWILNLPTT